MIVALDDSQIHRGGLFLYSHALVYEDGRTPESIVLLSDSKVIYRPSWFITDFVTSHLPDYYTLIACSHYADHPGIWPLVTASSLDKLSKMERILFSNAHHEARQAALDVLNIIKYNPSFPQKHS